MIEKKLTKKQRTQLIALLVLAFIIIMAALYTILAPKGDDKTHIVYKEEMVMRGNVVQGVTENGSLTLEESSIRYDILLDSGEEDEDDDEDDEDEEDETTIPYLTIDEIFVVKGQRIQEGDPLFSFTDKSMEAVLKRTNSQMTQAKIALDEANSEYQTSVLSAENTYSASMLQAQNAAGLKNASRTILEQEINALQAEIAVLELEIDQCLKDLTDEDFLDSYNKAIQEFEKAAKDLDETNIASAAAYSANYTEYQSAKSQYDSVMSQKENWEKTITDNQEKIIQNQLDMQELNRKMETELLAVENTYELSKQSGELAEKIYSYTKNSLSETVEAAQAEYDAAIELVDELEAFIGDGIVYATEGGMVTGILYDAGDELITTGDVITYAQTDDYVVSVDVSEEDIAQISIGDSVSVEFDAYPEDDFEGTVVSITTTKTSDHAKTVSYPVTILVNGDTEKLFGGMTAGITFVTDKAEDVLYVSKKAVIESNGKTWVYVDGSNGEKILKEVTTGFENSTLVEITNGLSEGDTVYIQSQAAEDLK